MSEPAVERTPSYENMSATTESTTNPDTVTGGSMQGAGREQGTFMGMPIEALRHGGDEHDGRQGIHDFVVVPNSTVFFRAPSLDEMLCWSKSRLRHPMTPIEDKMVVKVALKCFRDLQRTMGDRRFGMRKHAVGTGPRALELETIQRNIELGLQEPVLRDELYLQVLKQVTNNPHRSSLMRGWEVMCAYSITFPPSKGLIPVFLKEIAQYHVELTSEQRARACEESDSDDPEIIRHRLSLMEHFVTTHLEKLSRTGPRGHLPSTDEIDNTMESPFKHQVFGVTLEEIMEYPENRDETGLYPKILTFLAESILLLKGNETEGIFRVPGFIDEVQMLRLRIQRGNYSIEGIKDPSTPASLLKLWFRELTEPIIPPSFYERCLLVGQDVEEAVRILDDLPETNCHVLKYLIKFLQVVGDPCYQPKTKMTISNLAMVFAPNVLRCPSDNPLVILANSKFEQSFLKVLINYLAD